MIKHGYAKRRKRHLLYNVWGSMKQRCLNKDDPAYDNYGGRGITVCNEWLSDSGAFINWCLNNGWAEGLELDRRENDGGYSPSNCRFITHAINIKNQRLLPKHNTSGYRGSSYDKSRGKWEAFVMLGVKKKHIGRYKNRIDAAVSRDSFVISNNLKLPLNFPQPITEIRL